MTLIRRKHKGENSEAIKKNYRDPKKLAELMADVMAMAEALELDGNDIGEGMSQRVKKHKKGRALT